MIKFKDAIYMSNPPSVTMRRHVFLEYEIASSYRLQKQVASCTISLTYRAVSLLPEVFE